MNGVEQNELNFNEQLFDDVKNGKLDGVKDAIENGACDVNAKDTSDFTLLHWAVRGGHLTVVKYLIEKGANINVKDRDDCTPLHFAADEDNLEIVEFLIINGANVNAKDENGGTPLHWAAFGGHLEIVAFLISKGANVNAKDKNGYTPLHDAARAGNPNVVEFLIRKNANINAEDKDGNTPLHLAAHEGHLNVAEFLIKHTLLNPSAEQLHFSQEELQIYWTKCAEELIKLEQENPGLLKFLYTKSFKEGVKIWGKNESIFQNEASLKKQCPEYADVLLYKATECKAVTSFGKFFAKHDVAFKVVGGLSLLAGAAFCAYGFLAAGLPLLILGILAFGVSTDIGWGMCERVSSKVGNLNAERHEETIEVS